MTSGLRRMRWWDVDAVAALEQSLFPTDTWSAEGFWIELAGWPATRHYVVVEDAGRVLAYAGLFAPPRSDADVQTLGVAPDVQGRGIGRLLVGALVDEARRRGCPAVLLEVRADNVAAQQLYRSCGFERISLRRGYYDLGSVDALVLRKRLS